MRLMAGSVATSLSRIRWLMFSALTIYLSVLPSILISMGERFRIGRLSFLAAGGYLLHVDKIMCNCVRMDGIVARTCRCRNFLFQKPLDIVLLFTSVDICELDCVVSCGQLAHVCLSNAPRGPAGCRHPQHPGTREARQYCADLSRRGVRLCAEPFAGSRWRIRPLSVS